MNHKKVYALTLLTVMGISLTGCTGCSSKKVTDTAVSSSAAEDIENTEKEDQAADTGRSDTKEEKAGLDAGDKDQTGGADQKDPVKKENGATKQSVKTDEKNDEQKKTDGSAAGKADSSKNDDVSKPVSNAENSTADKTAGPAGGSSSKPSSSAGSSSAGTTETKPSAPAVSPSQPKPSAPTVAPSKPAEPAKPVHTHSWTQQTTTVHHAAETTTVWVVDQQAYDEPVYEDVPVYESVGRVRCRCGAVFALYEEWKNHRNFYVDNEDYSHGSYSVFWENVQTGTDRVQTGTVHHDEVGHSETKIVKEAYDETVVTGYKCTGCGATK